MAKAKRLTVLREMGLPPGEGCCQEEGYMGL